MIFVGDTVVSYEALTAWLAVEEMLDLTSVHREQLKKHIRQYLETKSIPLPTITQPTSARPRTRESARMTGKKPRARKPSDK